MSTPKVVLLIFVSGKLVITGAKGRAEIYSAFEKMKPVLFEFNKKHLESEMEASRENM